MKEIAEKIERDCPNGWWNCELCARERECKAGLYHGEIDRVVEVADIAEKQIVKEAIKSALVIKGLQSDNDFWGWWSRSSPPNLHAKEALPLDGPSSPGGGSKSNVKKSKKGNKPTQYVWGDN